jgi:predicted nucleic acid-binding protein
MRDKVFLDSNIILFINEVVNILYRKFKLDSKSIENVILEIENNFVIVNFSLTTQTNAIKIKEKYKLQYYDSLILATALENNCSVLYSEDMQHKQRIENTLTIIDPFE